MSQTGQEPGQARAEALGWIGQALTDFTGTLPPSARQPLVNEARRHLGVLEAMSVPVPREAVNTEGDALPDEFDDAPGSRS